MSEPTASERCPRCDAELESGFIATQQAMGLFGLPKRVRIFFCPGQFKMGFLGSPKGEDVSGRSTHRKYMAIPATRCRECRWVVFHY